MLTFGLLFLLGMHALPCLDIVNWACERCILHGTHTRRGPRIAEEHRSQPAGLRYGDCWRCWREAKTLPLTQPLCCKAHRNSSAMRSYTLPLAMQQAVAWPLFSFNNAHCSFAVAALHHRRGACTPSFLCLADPPPFLPLSLLFPSTPHHLDSSPRSVTAAITAHCS